MTLPGLAVLAVLVTGLGARGLLALGDVPLSLPVGLLATHVAEVVAWIALYLARYRRARCAPALLLLPLATFVYTSVPLVVLASGYDVYPFAERTVAHVSVLESLFLGFVWPSLYVCVTPLDALHLQRATARYLRSIRPGAVGLHLFGASGVVLSGLYAANYHFSGAGALADASRAEVMAAAETGKTWLLQYAFTAWLMALAVLFFSPRARSALRRTHAALIALACAVYLSFYLRLGNRRELLAFSVFVAVLALIRGYRRAVLVGSMIVIPLGLFAGFWRMLNGEPDLGQLEGTAEAYLGLYGEFIFPHFPMLYNVEMASPPRLGATYLESMGTVIPSFGAWERRRSLGAEFAAEYADSSMGFAYTPLAEGYLNFSALSPLIVALLVAGIVRLLWASGRCAPLATLVFSSMPLDVNRGELVQVLTQFAEITLIMFFFLAIARASARHPPECSASTSY